ncbi:apextrin [Elysia marginata]|uniref:Apextrin n=1 Tax=Elysia marginata TaxID=1093978 RepID=A0AAV4HRT7_9GAST|nr:apextrin [Elysia marginata]
MVLHQLSLLASLLVLHRGLTLPVPGVSDPRLPLQLTVTPALVNRYSAKKMSLRCEHNPRVPTELVEIFRIRIFKQSTSGWDLVAEQRDSLTRPTVTGSSTAALANVQGEISDAFLQVSWDTLGPDCFGVFKCNVIGSDSNADAVIEKSATLEVSEFKNFIHHLIGLSRDTQDKMKEMENFTDTEIARLNSGFRRLIQSVKTNQSAFDSRLDSLEDRITQRAISTESEMSQLKNKVKSNKDAVVALRTDQYFHKLKLDRIESDQIATKDRVANLISNRLKQMTSYGTGNQSDVETKLESLTNQDISTSIEIFNLKKSVDAIHTNQSAVDDLLFRLESLFKRLNRWPSGSYALLQPKTGCPVDLAFYGGNRAYLKIHAEMVGSDLWHSHSSAFSGNTISGFPGNVVTLEFCEVTAQFSSVNWPQGSFCINKLLSKSCPMGFTDGYIRFDSENINHVGIGRNNVAYRNFEPWLYFCCQNTSSTDVPMQLPTHSPFFLYRYGGVCQAVQGMSVSEEYVRIDTDNTSPNRNSLYGRHPDIDQPGSSAVKLNLCYYT